MNELTTYTPPRKTYRQIRLLAWILHPKADLAWLDDPAVEKRNLAWSAAQIAEHAGIYENSPAGRRACLADLHVLHKRGEVTKLGSERNTQWMRFVGW